MNHYGVHKIQLAPNSFNAVLRKGGNARIFL
jgi:hypothetical protein